MYNNVIGYVRSLPEKFTAGSDVFNLLNLSIPVLIGMLIFLNPFPHITSIKEICFYLSVFIVLVLVACRKVELSLETPLLIPFGLFVFWGGLSIFFALDKGNSIHDFYAHLLKYIIFYYILINFFNTRKRFSVLSWVIITSSSIFAIWGLVYYYLILGNALTERWFVSINVTQTPTNTMVIIFAIAALLALHIFLTDKDLYRRIICFVCIFPLASTVFLTQTRAAFLGLFLGVVVILLRNKKALIISLVVLTLIFFLMPVGKRFSSELPRELSGYSVRLHRNLVSLEVVKDYPIIGIGFSQGPYWDFIDIKKYNERVPEKIRQSRSFPTNAADAHNMLLGIAVRLGLVGLALFLYILFAFARMCWKIVKYGKDDFIKGWGLCVASLMVMYIVSGITGTHACHMLELVFYTIFSMITILWRLNTEEKARKSEGN